MTPAQYGWLLTVQRIGKWLFVVAVLGMAGALLFGEARAQTVCPVQPACDPRTEPDRTKCGPELTGTTATGLWRGWWWAHFTGPTTWLWCPFLWAGLDKYAPKTPAQYLAIVDTIKDAASPTLGIMAALSAFSVKPAVGSQDEFDYRTLRYAGCQAMAAAPPGPQGWTPGMEPKCTAPTAPVPVPPPVAIYVVTGSQAFPLNADGSRSIVPIAVPPTKGSPCDCAARTILQFGARFCAVTIPGITQPVVAGCSPQK